MKILTVGEFDPCGVHLRHRQFLRALGHDVRLAVRDVYWAEGVGADWWTQRIVAGSPTPAPNPAWDLAAYDELRAFAAGADIVQVLPAIGQPWSTSDARVHLDFGVPEELSVPLEHARRVACFHGSMNAARWGAHHARWMRDHGFAVVATTLDYVDRLEAGYLPAIVDVGHLPPAKLRLTGERMRIIHTPTDRRACGTDAFLAAMQALPVDVEVMTGVPHDLCLERKRRYNAGFDHLRGAFSVNSLENAALGLVNLVGVKREYRAWLTARDLDVPFPAVETLDDVVSLVRELAHREELHRAWQSRARDWAVTTWAPTAIAKRVEAVYRGLM